MANKDLPYGLRPVKHLSGSPYNGATMKCYGKSTYAVALYVGDPVLMDGTSCTRGCCPSLILGVTGQGAELLGAIASVDPNVNEPNIIHRPASTERYINVVVDPDVIFEIQGVSGTAFTIADVGTNGLLVDTANTASAALGLSCFELESTSADKTEQLWIMGVADRNDNDITLATADWLVMINTHCIGNGGGQGALGRVLGI